MNKNLFFAGLSIIVFILIVVGLLTSQNTSNDATINLSQDSMNNATELKIEDIQEGTGSAVVESGDDIVIHYKGTLPDGTVFDSSYDRGEPFQTQIGVGAVIQGWDEGVLGMKVGGKRKLTIPPDKAYGESGTPDGTIPPNSTLIFEVELVEILK